MVDGEKKYVIKITLNTILNSQEIFRQLATTPMKAKTAFKIARIIKNAENELEIFNKTRNELLNKYAQRNDDGTYVTTENNEIIIDPQKIDECNEDFTNLLNTTIEWTVEKIKIEELENAELTPQQINLINDFLDE